MDKIQRPEWQNVLRAGRAKALTLDEASNNRHRIHWTHRRMCLVYFRLNIFIFLCLHSSSMPPRFTLLPGTFFFTYLLQYGWRFAFSTCVYFAPENEIIFLSFRASLTQVRRMEGKTYSAMCACTMQMQNFRCEINEIFFWPFPRTEPPVSAWALSDDSKF